jgi:protease-4
MLSAGKTLAACRRYPDLFSTDSFPDYSMRRHPFLIGFISLCCIGVVFLCVLWALGRFGLTERLLTGQNDIAVIEIEGVITKSKPVVDKLLRYKKDDSIRALLLRINSPGGGVGPSQEIYSELMKMRDKKKIIASMESVAASGGYYIACAAHKIVANPGTITGSIGVIIEFVNIEELLGKIGLKSVIIKSGKYKDILSPTRTMSPEEQALLQGVIDSVHNQFIDAVAKGRKLPREKVVQIADGRIFSGEQAKTLGLVDQLGNFQDALDTAAQLCGIKGEPRVLFPEKRRPSLWEFFIDESAARLKALFEDEQFKFGYVLNTQYSER